MKKKEKWMKFRHRVAWVILYPILAVITFIKFPIRVERLNDRRDRPYLILFNHQTPFDQFFVGLAFRGPIYFVSTEDILSNGFVSKVIKWLLAPIPIKKQAGDFSAVMTTLRVAREGATIAMAHRGLHIVREYEEGTASRDDTAVESHTVHNACHGELGNTCLEEVTTEVTLSKCLSLLQEAVGLI